MTQRTIRVTNKHVEIVSQGSKVIKPGGVVKLCTLLPVQNIIFFVEP